MAQLKKNNIIIIGAGITGLSLLHYLARKYEGRDDLEINLFERNDHPGGTIQSLKSDLAIFETGPNGFLGNKEQTLELVDQMGLRKTLIQANDSAKLRYINVQGTLHEFPMDLKVFFKSKLLSIFSKMRILCEPFIKKSGEESESVYDFVKRRFGSQAAEYLMDPVVSGIYAGDARKTVTKIAFPQLYHWEQQYGSIIKGIKKEKKGDSEKPKLHSFEQGMEQIISALYEKYKSAIHLNSEIIKVFHRDDRYVISTEKDNFKADELFICTPAHVSSVILQHLDRELCDNLKFINYSPVVVIGILMPKDAFINEPRGYGYLNPLSENKEVLGVLFESNVFANRASEGDILFRFILGGARHSNVHLKSKKELVDLAYEELEAVFPTRGNTSLTKINARNVTHHIWSIVWEKAIPQYDQVNMEMNDQIDEKLKRFRDLYLLGNYRGGVSFNDCVENAFMAAQRSSL